MPDLGLTEYTLTVKLDKATGTFTYAVTFRFRGAVGIWGEADERPTVEQCTEAAQAYLARVIADAVMG